MPNMSSRSARHWLARVRALSHRRIRDAEGVCIVEGIHATTQAIAAGLHVEAVLLCTDRVRSPEVWAWVEMLRGKGVPLVELSGGQFARVARMDNPVALVAIAGWRPLRLAGLLPVSPRLAVIAEDLDDAGNLGSLIRTADAAGADTVIAVGAGADPAQRKCLRASLGTAFRLPVATAVTSGEALAWARSHGYTVLATSPGAPEPYTGRWRFPVAVVFGNERPHIPAGPTAAPQSGSRRRRSNSASRSQARPSPSNSSRATCSDVRRWGYGITPGTVSGIFSRSCGCVK